MTQNSGLHVPKDNRSTIQYQYLDTALFDLQYEANQSNYRFQATQLRSHLLAYAH
jgi:hypothetical protein